MSIFDPNIEKFVQKRDINGLLKLLINRKKAIREAAAQALNRVTNEDNRFEICLSLLELLEKRDWYRNIEIVKALGHLNCKEATNSICNLINESLSELDIYASKAASHALEGKFIKIQTDTDSPALSPSALYSNFINCAVIALGKLKDKESLDTLKKVVEYKSPSQPSGKFVQNAKNAINKIKGKITLPDIKDMEAKKDVDSLLAVLKFGDVMLVSKATKALGKIRDQKSVDPLIQKLMDKDYKVQIAAIEALGELGSNKAIEPLSKLLNDKRKIIREKAAWAIEFIQEE